MNGGFNSDHIDIGDLNNKCLNESIFNNDKTDFDYLNYKFWMKAYIVTIMI